MPGRGARVSVVLTARWPLLLGGLGAVVCAGAFALSRTGPSPTAPALRDLTARSTGQPATPAKVHRTSRPGARVPALRASWQAGVNITANAAADLLDAGSDAGIQTAAQERETSIEIVPTWYMTTATSSAIDPDPVRTPSDASVIHAATTAMGLGLRVLLKPQLDVLDGTYRGRLDPADRSAWFTAYRTMLIHYATMARQLSLPGLVVGVELGSMVDRAGDTGRWERLIRRVRSLGYRGVLTYAANWDQLRTVGFWRSLDFIGIDAYFPLIPKDRRYSPTTEELVSAWHGSYLPAGRVDWVAEIDRLHRTQGRPIVFTELGYGATACAAVAPYSLTPRCAFPSVRSKPTERAQQNAYVAALRVWSRVPYVNGIFWWDWPTNANQAGDFYSPRGKLAERSLVLWNSARGVLR